MIEIMKYEVTSKFCHQRSWNMMRRDLVAVAELVRVWKGWEGEFRFVQNLTISATGFAVSGAGIQTEIDPSLRLALPPGGWNMRE